MGALGSGGSVSILPFKLDFLGSDRRQRGKVFRLSTDHRRLDVYVTNYGRSLRVFDPDAKADNGKLGKELT